MVVDEPYELIFGVWLEWHLDRNFFAIPDARSQIPQGAVDSLNGVPDAVVDRRLEPGATRSPPPSDWPASACCR
jgi:hypothetical protein